MGRVRANIQVNGRKLWTLFDPGAINTYVVEDCVGGLHRSMLPKPFRAGLAGRRPRVRYECILMGTIEGRLISVKARIVDDIGKDEEKKRIEVLFGALAMEEWGINVDTRGKKLDYRFYRKEFVEF